MTGLSHDLAAWMSGLAFEDLPGRAVDAARLCILDTIGSALAGSGSGVARRVLDYVVEDGGPGPAAIWGADRTARPDLAALVNGAAAHALDFDETNPTSIGHPSAVLVPCLLALVQVHRCSGRELLTAFAAGYEVTAKLGGAANPHLYDKGWWTTGLLGVIGAAGAGARLLGLDLDRTASALGLAATFASGLRANFGAMAKPFGAGKAAMDALMAARLAAAGLTARHDILDGNGPFFRMINDGLVDVDKISLGQPFDLVDPGVSFKRFPSCSSTHAAVDATLELAVEHDLDPAGVDSVHCLVAPLVKTCLVFDSPTRPDEARFSLQACVAGALTGRSLDTDFFTRANLADPGLRRLMDRVTMEVTAEFDAPWPGGDAIAQEGARVIITTTDGRRLSRTAPFARGSSQAPLTRAELTDKFETHAVPKIGPRKAGAVRDMVLGLEGLDDAGLVAAGL